MSKNERRYIVAMGSMKRTPWEVVDTDGSDGGPECVALCYTEGDARQIARALNATEAPTNA